VTTDNITTTFNIRRASDFEVISRGIRVPNNRDARACTCTKHIDLVLSQLSVEALHSLQSSVTQEIQLRVEMITMELAKVNEDNATLQVEYNRLVQERDEAVQRQERLH